MPFNKEYYHMYRKENLTHLIDDITYEKLMNPNHPMYKGDEVEDHKWLKFLQHNKLEDMAGLIANGETFRVLKTLAEYLNVKHGLPAKIRVQTYAREYLTITGDFKDDVSRKLPQDFVYGKPNVVPSNPPTQLEQQGWAMLKDIQRIIEEENAHGSTESKVPELSVLGNHNGGGLSGNAEGHGAPRVGSLPHEASGPDPDQGDDRNA